MQQDPTSPPAEGVPMYQVTRTEDSTMIGANGGFQRSKRIYFALADGTTSYVEVPLTAFTRGNVEKLIQAHVADLLDVSQIQGPLVPPSAY